MQGESAFVVQGAAAPWLNAAAPSGTSLNSISSRFLRNPMAPGLVAWGLLALAYLLTFEYTPGKTRWIVGIGVIFVALFFLARRTLVQVPSLPPRDAGLLLLAGFGVFALEVAYFGGFPLLGHVPYNEFGLPVLHHVVFSMWAVPLLTTRRAGLYLFLVLAAAALMFNRQMMVLALIAYLMRSAAGRMFFAGVVGASLIVLGSVRNTLHDVQEVVSQGGEFVTGALGSFLFWAYLYLLGPYTVTLGADSPDVTVMAVLDYWNTVPDWMVFTNLGLSAEWSLLLFYPLLALAVVLLTRVPNFEARAFGALVQVMGFVTFFSNTLLSTPVIGTLLIVVFLRRGQQYGRPRS